MVLNLKTIQGRDIKMNDKEKIVKKILFEIIDKLSKDADVYNHNGSLWLINTDSTKWIFEFTKSKTLWYNYNFFRSALKFVSLDINEGDNQKYITEWFESKYLNINQVKYTENLPDNNPARIEDTIQNGVKDTRRMGMDIPKSVEDTIQHGVKRTSHSEDEDSYDVEDTIQNGVKYTDAIKGKLPLLVEDAIQNGVKEIKNDNNNPHSYHHKWTIDYTIQNGVKETKADLGIQSIVLEDTIKNGVKHTLGISNHRMGHDVDDTIQNGVKETKTVDNSNVVENAVEQLYRHLCVDDTIQNGVKHTEKSLQIDGSCVIEDTIQNGVKRTLQYVKNLTSTVEEVIQNGFKEEIKK
jgi:hypothetical protein